MTWYNKGAVTACYTQLLSLGHIGEAIKTAAMIDVPGQFVSKSENSGMRAVLKECSYNNAHNVNC